MKLSAKIEYTLKAMIELGLSDSVVQALSLSKIAREHQISMKFLLQLMLRIKSAGLVKSQRGIGGGYMLTRHPRDIKLAEIISAVDSTFFENESKALSEGAVKDFVILNMWKDYNDRLQWYFKDISLETLIEEFRKRGKISYSI